MFGVQADETCCGSTLIRRFLSLQVLSGILLPRLASDPPNHSPIARTQPPYRNHDAFAHIRELLKLPDAALHWPTRLLSHSRQRSSAYLSAKRIPAESPSRQVTS